MAGKEQQARPENGYEAAIQAQERVSEHAPEYETTRSRKGSHEN